MLLYVVCTAGEFVWNEGGVVPATCALYHDVWFFTCDLKFQILGGGGVTDCSNWQSRFTFDKCKSRYWCWSSWSHAQGLFLKNSMSYWVNCLLLSADWCQNRDIFPINCVFIKEDFLSNQTSYDQNCFRLRNITEIPFIS